MSEYQPPKTYREKYLAERAKLYQIRETLDNAILELISGESVVSYTIGQRSVSRTKADLKSMQEALKELDKKIDDLEALLSGRSPRNVQSHSYVQPAATFWWF